MSDNFIIPETIPGTASISDALDFLGLPGALLNIKTLRNGQKTLGPAYTVKYEPVDENGGTVGDFLDDVPNGNVVVIDNDARTDCTVWGGIMSRVAGRLGVAGTVINGACRDTEEAAAVGYPLWSVVRYMRTGKDRVRVRAVQEPLEIAGVSIYPGDIVVGDDDGIVIVPRTRWKEVLDRAVLIEEVEDRVVATVLAGSSLRDARAQHGYHSLQTKKNS